MLSRISQLFSRSRICIEELQANTFNSRQRFIITVRDTKENARKISKKIEVQVDVITVHLFEQTK